MLKGSTKIELTDVTTGEKQVIEKHNLVTGAVSNLYQPTLGHATDGAVLRNLDVNTLFGGLLLFDNTLPNEATQWFAPAGANITGHGVQGVQSPSTNALLGSYNSADSTYDAATKTARFVYDFSTNQANGTISAVCLSHKMTGYGGYGTDKLYTTALDQLMMVNMYDGLKALTDNTDKLVGSKDLTYGKEYLFLVDPEKDIAVYFVISGGTTIKFKKYHTRLKTYSLFETGTAVSTLVSAGETSEISLGISIAAGTFSYNYDYTDNSLYIRAGGTVANNASFTLTKVTYEDTPVVTQTTITNTSGVTIGNTSNRNTFVHDGYVYIVGNSSPYNIYKINIETLDYTAVPGVSVSGLIPVMGLNGIIYYQKATGTMTSPATYLLDTYSNSIKKCGITNINYVRNKGTGSDNYTYYTPVYVPVKGDTMLYYSCYTGTSTITGDGVGFRYFTNYLATINNISPAIVKTDTTTMKITYTIQEE